MNFRVFNKLFICNHGLKQIFLDEVIVRCVSFIVPRFPSGVGNAKR